MMITDQVEAGGLMALRNVQRKQVEELEDTSKPTSKEIKRRIVGLVTELIRDNVIWNLLHQDTVVGDAINIRLNWFGSVLNLC